jgi:FlaA1/EpsC-like NDP-sugar epimerase
LGTLAHLPVFVVAFILAFQLRFDGDVPEGMQRLMIKSLPWILAVKLLAFHLYGFHGWWRFVTFSDLTCLLKTAAVSTVVIICGDYLFLPSDQIPRSVLAIDFGASILLIGGLRSSWRLVDEHFCLSLQRREPALMIGAGNGGARLVQEIHRTPHLPFRVIGFLDDNPKYRGTRVAGVPFLGPPHALVEVTTRHKVKDLLVISKSISGARLRRLLNLCRVAEIHLKMIPALDEVLAGHFQMRFREVDIHDLLRRDPVHLDCGAISQMLHCRTVLVTGAGGSIGSEICRQVAHCEPQALILVERAENSLFWIEQELRELAPSVQIIPHLADIGDRQQLRRIFERHRPQIVFHAAANKHVPLIERNPGAAVANNILGTKIVADLASCSDVERFVMISTDKAVNPKSVMGVSKQIAERYVSAVAEDSSTKFVVVRFGNVLGSEGSVVPVFQRQIRRGGPITVTHPEMQRYFMTIPEASQLVLQAAAIGSGGEIFVLDMGRPIKIIDLATDLVRLSGLSENEIEIKIVGLRPGEKLSEELYSSDEQTLQTEHPRIRAAYRPSYTKQEVEEAIAELRELIYAPPELIIRKLRDIVPDYRAPEVRAESPDQSPISATEQSADVLHID